MSSVDSLKGVHEASFGKGEGAFEQLSFHEVVALNSVHLLFLLGMPLQSQFVREAFRFQYLRM